MVPSATPCTILASYDFIHPMIILSSFPSGKDELINVSIAKANSNKTIMLEEFHYLEDISNNFDIGLNNKLTFA